MFKIILYGVLIIILFMLVLLTYQFRHILKFSKVNDADVDMDEERKEKFELSQGFIYASILLAIIVVLVVTYFLIKGTAWEGHFMEWLNIVVRLMHVTFGIAWIGASFYFVFLENALNRTKDVREELAG